MVTRKLVSPSTTAAVTPGCGLMGFVRAGYVRDAVDAHEADILGAARETIAEK
jgi:hypothetical protein